MQTSRVIAKVLDDITHNMKKNNLIEPTHQDQQHLESVFLKSVRLIPKGMAFELFEYGWQSFLQGIKETLPEFCDVILMEYDTEAAILNTDDWEFFSDVVNEYATQIDMELVEYIMRFVVENDAL
jgi:hypothetical protein